MGDVPPANPRTEDPATAAPEPLSSAILRQQFVATEVGATIPGDALLAVSAARNRLPPEFLDGYQIIGDAPIGEGGMGVVWKAVQNSTRRTVALKVMSAASFGSERARLRFEREVELTAKLDHPNIARVYDSGVRSGVFFYSMELIDGVPLDVYVKRERQTRADILSLMQQICRAVQHAHQKGVIHRDLKPSNILIDMDGQPHVLDFGLAKIAEGDQQLSLDGEVAGTPAYMSPEQAAGRLDTLDTRSDVYTLGVILFHLLCGRFPHDVSGSAIEVMRRISEQEPRRLKDIEPHADRELEVLLSKTLAREPERRYGSAGELADDLDRYLKHEPLIAQPPTLSYLFSKKLNKYRLHVTIAAGVCVLLFIAVIAYIHTIQAARETLAAEQKRTLAALAEARAQRDEADRQRAMAAKEKDEAKKQAAIAGAIGQFQSDMLSAADPRRLLGDKVSVLQATQEAVKKLDAGSLKGQPLVEAGVRNTIGKTLLSLGRYSDAEPELRKALEIRRKSLPPGDPGIAASLNNLARVLQDQNKPVEAEPLFREAVEIHRKAFGPGHPAVAASLNNLALLLKEQNRLAEAEPLFRESLDIRRRTLPAGSPSIATSLDNLATLLQAQNKLAEAEPLFREALAIYRGALPAMHPDIATSLNNLASLLQARNKLSEAELLFRQSLEITRKTFPTGHPQLAMSLGNLASLLQARNKLTEAEPLFREALEIFRKALQPGHRHIATSLNNLAWLLQAENKFAEAEPLYHEALEIYHAALPAGHPDIVMVLNNLASLLQARGRPAEAEKLYLDELESWRRQLPRDDPRIADLLAQLEKMRLGYRPHCGCGYENAAWFRTR